MKTKKRMSLGFSKSNSRRTKIRYNRKNKNSQKKEQKSSQSSRENEKEIESGNYLVVL